MTSLKDKVITVVRKKGDDEAATDSSFGKVEYSLILDDEVVIELYVPYTGSDTVTAAIDVESLTNNPVKDSKNIYTVTTDGIPAHLLGTAKSIVLTAGNETCTVSVSGYSYVHSVLSLEEEQEGYSLSKLKQAVIALYKYGQAADTYNTSPN